MEDWVRVTIATDDGLKPAATCHVSGHLAGALRAESPQRVGAEHGETHAGRGSAPMGFRNIPVGLRFEGLEDGLAGAVPERWFVSRRTTCL